MRSGTVTGFVGYDAEKDLRHYYLSEPRDVALLDFQFSLVTTAASPTQYQEDGRPVR
jgi:hypothetical protein